MGLKNNGSGLHLSTIESAMGIGTGQGALRMHCDRYLRVRRKIHQHVRPLARSRFTDRRGTRNQSSRADGQSWHGAGARDDVHAAAETTPRALLTMARPVASCLV